MKKTVQKTLVAAAAGALVGLMSQSAMAAGNLLPAIKVGGGWVSVVSYVNTAPTGGGAAYVHATHQSKDITATGSACVHLDGRSTTTVNDLTTTVMSTNGGAVGAVFPTADTVGGALIQPPLLAVPTSEGFLVLENYNSGGVLGAAGTLTSDAIVFNLASGYLYSSRGLEITHTAASPSGALAIDAPGGLLGRNTLTATGVNNTLAAGDGVNNTGPGVVAVLAAPAAAGGSLTRFTFLPPAAPASTGAYVIPMNRATNVAGTGAEDALTTNLVAAGYRATATYLARMDNAQGFAQGIYDRLEGSRSLSIANTVTCLAQLSPQQITGNTVPSFIANGGWFNLNAVAQTNGSGTANMSDSSLAYKVEFATGYGLSIQPLHQQWHAK